MIKTLPDLTGQKKGSQQDAKRATMSLDELDGRAYTNLKMLAEVRRAYWNEHKNKRRAVQYQLNNGYWIPQVPPSIPSLGV